MTGFNSTVHKVESRYGWLPPTKDSNSSLLLLQALGMALNCTTVLTVCRGLQTACTFCINTSAGECLTTTIVRLYLNRRSFWSRRQTYPELHSIASVIHYTFALIYRLYRTLDLYWVYPLPSIPSRLTVSTIKSSNYIKSRRNYRR